MRKLILIVLLLINTIMQAQTNQGSQMTTYIRLYLQAYTNPGTGEMSDSLSKKHLIPIIDNTHSSCFGLQRPYDRKWVDVTTGDTLWIPNGFSTKLVDWVQIELRSISSPITTYSQQGVLTTKGDVLDAHCRQMKWGYVPFGWYFIVVHPRNHLSIMSVREQYLQNYSNFYDFTLAKEMARGKEPQVRVSEVPEIWATFAGDCSSKKYVGSENVIDIDDQIMIYNNYGRVGYNLADITGNGLIDFNDLIYCQDNLGRVSYVPYIGDTIPHNVVEPLKDNELAVPRYTLTATNFIVGNDERFDIYMKRRGDEDFVFAACQFIVHFDTSYFNGGNISASLDNIYVQDMNVSILHNDIRIFAFNTDTSKHLSTIGQRICTVKLSNNGGGFIGKLNPLWNNSSPLHTKIFSFIGNYMYNVTDSNYHYIDKPSVIVGVPGVAVNSLGQNYPNPFNPSTNISFQLVNSSFVVLEVYDIRGKLIEADDYGMLNSDIHSIKWYANNLASGVYLYRLRITDGKETRLTSVREMELIK